MKTACLVAASVLALCLPTACKSDPDSVSTGIASDSVSRLRRLIDLPLGIAAAEVAASIGNPTEDVGSGVCIWRYEISHRGLVILWFDLSNRLQSICAYWQSESYEVEQTQAFLSRIEIELRAAALTSAAHPSILKVDISEAMAGARGSRWDIWLGRGAAPTECGDDVCALACLREGGFVKLIKGDAEDVKAIQIFHSKSNVDGGD